MREIHIPESLYRQAQEAARADGVEVDSFIAEVVRKYFADDPDNYDHLFTPEVLEELDRRWESAKAGNVKTLDEVEADFIKMRDEWIRKHES